MRSQQDKRKPARMINSVSNSTSSVQTDNVRHRLTIRKSFLSDKIASVSHVNINLHPKGVDKGVKLYRAVSREIIRGNQVLMGYINDFRNTGEEALLIHGTKTGKVALLSHRVDDRKEFSVSEFICHLEERHHIDLRKHRTRPLHLMSCYGPSNGVYQAFADELQRVIIGYGDGGVVATTSRLANHFDASTSTLYSVSGETETNKMKNLQFTYASVRHYVPADPAGG